MLQERNLVALPLQPQGSSSAHMAHLVILRRFEFRPQLLRSGVVVRASMGPPNDAQLFIRGASAAVEQLVGPDNIPADYQQVDARMRVCMYALPPRALGLIAHAKSMVHGLCR